MDAATWQLWLCLCLHHISTSYRHLQGFISTHLYKQLHQEAHVTTRNSLNTKVESLNLSAIPRNKTCIHICTLYKKVQVRNTVWHWNNYCYVDNSVIQIVDKYYHWLLLQPSSINRFASLIDVTVTIRFRLAASAANADQSMLDCNSSNT